MTSSADDADISELVITESKVEVIYWFCYASVIFLIQMTILGTLLWLCFRRCNLSSSLLCNLAYFCFASTAVSSATEIES
mmetsp:Transcript_3891/g.4898  ORF Transcript_3891/g.4898 Transcript_3891/m.4898 type:complete len:80 (+) Transcript_3891:70-309(+)